MPWTCPTHPYATLLGLLLLLLLAPSITAQQPPPWTDSSNPNYNSPMATALIVMIIVFFSVGFVSVYLRHFLACLGFYPNGGTRRGGGGGWTREAPRGLDPSIVSTFPTFLYSDVKVHRVGKTTPLECAICLSEFADHEILRLLPKCNHVFHPHCVDPWLGSHVTCPVCRANLEIIQTYNNNQRPFDHHHTTSEDEAEPQPSDQDLRQDDVIVRVEASPEMITKSPTPQEIVKGLSLSESGRIIRLPRSHSTGHSLVGDSDRFTLRLPDEVRNKLVIDNNYCFSGLPGAIVSPRVGYGAENVGCTGIPGKPDRWLFSMSPPFISRPNSPKVEVANNSSSTNNNSNNNNITAGGLLRSPKNLLRSIRSPNKSSLQRIVSCNDIGERSSDRLWANRDTREL